MKVLLGTLSIILLCFTLFAASTPGAEAITIISSSPSEIRLEITLPRIQIRGRNINTLKMGDLEILREKGLPPLPIISGIVAIDDEGEYSGIVENNETYEMELGELPVGLRERYPERTLLLDEPQILRDFRIVRFQFHPVEYLPENGKLRITTRATITIRKTEAHGKNEKHFSREKISQAFENLYRKTILNFDALGRFSSDTVLLLIITPDAYESDILPLAQWKEETGILTQVVRFSDIGSNPTYSQIRTFIYNLYVNPGHPPDYFLAIGDAGIFPVKYSYDYSGFPGSYANDNYYVCMDSQTEVFPDIFGGRLPIQNSFQVQTMLNKIINFEESPYTLDPFWLNRAIMIASNEYPTQAQIKQRIREKLLGFGLSYVDSIYAKNYSSSYWIGVDIENAVNEGRCILNYRGPGWTSGWYATFGYIFTINQVAGLTNDRKTPVITSIGCGVAKFDEFNCYGEQWLRNGSPTMERGAVSFFGPTWNSHTRHNNKIDRGIYAGFIDEGLTTFGEVTTRAKYYMYDICGPSDTTDTEMNEYLILGDPTLLIRKKYPDSLNVQHPASAPLGRSVLLITVSDDNGVVKDAFVCARMDGSFHVSHHTDDQGMVALPINAQVADTITITAIAPDHFLYKGYCLVKDTGPYVVYRNHTVDDDSNGTSAGNANGIPNPGEQIELPVLVGNKGNQDAVDVLATLRSQDIYVTISDSVESLGTVSAGDSVFTPDDFDFSISSSAPDLHSIPFELVVQDSAGTSWESNFSLTIHSPIIKYVSHRIDDSGQPGPNSILDPGETAFLICRLKNSGSVDAVGVTAILRSEDSYIVCDDSVSTYGDIPPMQDLEGTTFSVTADSATPAGHEAVMKLVYSTTDGYTDSTDFSITVGMGTHFLIWDLDLNKNSGPELQTALEANGFRGIYTTDISDFIHMLDVFQAIFICVGINPYNHVLEDGPSIDSLCAYLNGGGRMYMEGGDTWCYDIPTALHPYFRIPEEYDGYNDTQTIYGQYGTFTYQMSFTYTGENHWMDRLATYGGSFSIFRNSGPYYLNGIAFDTGSLYRTVGVSFEFGGLQDGSPPSTKKILADSIMHFFGILGIEENDRTAVPLAYALLPCSPNPCNNQGMIRFQVPVKSRISLKVYDISGRIMETLINEEVEPGHHSVWLDTKQYPSGVYFYRLEAGNRTFTRKMVVVK